MIRSLLLRGLLAGVVAGLLAGTFAFAFGEPLLQNAIDIEETASAQAPAAHEHEHAEEPLVTRPGQRGGLFLATALYGACVGTIFALGFALVRGRGTPRDDWQLAVRLAAGLFAALVLVPFLKYPANPPAVGDPDTIGQRTWLYLAMVAGGLISLVAASRVMWSISDRAASWVRPVLGVGTFVVLAGFLALMLPGIDEVPETFPASLLWQFRMSSLGTQAVLWTTLGTTFGILSVRAGAPARGSPEATTA